MAESTITLSVMTDSAGVTSATVKSIAAGIVAAPAPTPTAPSAPSTSPVASGPPLRLKTFQGYGSRGWASTITNEFAGSYDLLVDRAAQFDVLILSNVAQWNTFLYPLPKKSTQVSGAFEHSYPAKTGRQFVADIRARNRNIRIFP